MVGVVRFGNRHPLWPRSVIGLSSAMRARLNGQRAFGSATGSTVAPNVLLVLADSNDTGLDVVAKALLVASAPGISGNTIYADSDRGGTGSPLDGELGLGDGNTLIQPVSPCECDRTPDQR